MPVVARFLVLQKCFVQAIFLVAKTYTVSLNVIRMLIRGLQMPSPHHLDTAGDRHLGWVWTSDFCQRQSTNVGKHVAPAQFSQILWAIALGGAFYGEYVDTPAIIGIATLHRRDPQRYV